MTIIRRLAAGAATAALALSAVLLSTSASVPVAAHANGLHSFHPNCVGDPLCSRK
jgi:hypothetical protein